MVKPFEITLSVQSRLLRTAATEIRGISYTYSRSETSHAANTVVILGKSNAFLKLLKELVPTVGSVAWGGFVARVASIGPAPVASEAVRLIFDGGGPLAA
jgi:hypothetical protein